MARRVAAAVSARTYFTRRPSERPFTTAGLTARSCAMVASCAAIAIVRWSRSVAVSTVGILQCRCMRLGAAMLSVAYVSSHRRRMVRTDSPWSGGSLRVWRAVHARASRIVRAACKPLALLRQPVRGYATGSAARVACAATCRSVCVRHGVMSFASPVGLVCAWRSHCGIPLSAPGVPHTRPRT
jgi:hypothetical protein